MRIRVLLGFLCAMACSPRLQAQPFSSGSTGADGALDLAASSCSTCEVQLPPDGILHYTTINVPAGKTLRIRPNIENTPAYLLAQGAVTIGGRVTVSANGYTFCGDQSREPQPGPGGFWGGPIGGPGFGPPGSNSTWVGPLSLVPLMGGGSGGGGSSGDAPARGGPGGGAIAIASSTSIEVAQGGQIDADGAGVFFFSACINRGSGGAIRLVSNQLQVRGSLSACGGACGVIRLEGPPGATTFTGDSLPVAVLSEINPVVVPVDRPSLSIVSVGGAAVPGAAGQRFDAADIVIPAQLADPIEIVVSATKIPPGTQVRVAFGTTNGGSVSPGVLSGSFESSSATVHISGLNRSQLAYLFASATFDVPQNAALSNAAGLNQVARIRLNAAPRAVPTVEFLRNDGTAVDAALLPPEFVSQFRRD